MKRLEVLPPVVLFLLLVPSFALAAPVCQPFTFQSEFGPLAMTAVVVNPSGPVTGEIDASGCDVGVFFGVPRSKGVVQNANIHGARLVGVLVGGQGISLNVDVVSSSIHDIGLPVPIRAEYFINGVAIAYASDFAVASGKITNNIISRYNWIGIYAAGADLQIVDNIISGTRGGFYSSNFGQIGIYSPFGKLIIDRNTIVDNVYTGEPTWWMAWGVIAQLVPGTKITQNVLVNNQNGMLLGTESLSSVIPATSATITGNRITADEVYSPTGRQSGMWLWGSRDKINGNVITGYGYDPATKPGFTDWMWVTEYDPRPKPR